MPLPYPDPCDGPPVFRFAPSPNGPLHRGHALSAILNFELARRHQGVFLLRIEDIDPERSRPEHVAAIEDALGWLGLVWQQPVRRQSHHFTTYDDARATLKARGVTYPCFCSRSDLALAVADTEGRGETWKRDPDGVPVYSGRCRHLGRDIAAARIAAGEMPQWRLDMEKALALTGPVYWRAFHPGTGGVVARHGDPARWGDVVIARKGLPTSYHLSVIVDDAVQKVSHVVRGTDLEEATDVHAVLQNLLGLPQPLYWHHPLILDPNGRKLAKSKGSLSLQEERANGLTPSDLWAQALAVLDQ